MRHSRPLFCLFLIFSSKQYKSCVAAIAPWFRLRLPSCSPGFGSQAHHLHFFQFVLLKLYQENNENKQKKRPGLAHFLKLCRGWSRTPRIFESQISDHYLPLVVSRNSYVIKIFFSRRILSKKS